MTEGGKIITGQMASFNHYALGHVAEVLHSYVGGLSPMEPGWKKVLVRPLRGGNLTLCGTSHLDLYGARNETRKRSWL